MLKWFNEISNKSQYTSITFDIWDFYPSITIELVDSALDFASSYADITNNEQQIILYARKSILFKSGKPWGKRTSEELFDVTMGSYDGAETCELVGSFILHQITKKYGKHFGLYRDDGLGIVSSTPRQVELIKKDLCAIFKQYGLKITIEANRKIVNFLDVTLNLSEEKYMPYTKPNNVPVYINSKSNHPPNIIKNIPISVNKRLSEISSDESAFKQAIPPYQAALTKSGYEHQLRFTPQPASRESNPRKRQRNITWFNPPFSNSIINNIGQKFFNIIDSEFTTNHKLHKLFNRNTIKLSYSCMDNIEQAINAHNKKTLANARDTDALAGCNCRIKDLCPLPEQCLTPSVVYQASVTTNNNIKPEQTYIGLTEGQFKTRYNNHNTSFRHESKRSSTELSRYIWELRDNNIQYNIKWKIVAKAKAYSNRNKQCNLCLTEKYFIIFRPGMATLNKRTELISTCRHARKFLLRNSTWQRYASSFILHTKF